MHQIEFVDLGLSVKWATCNLGANLPSEYGDYYSWNDIAYENKKSKDIRTIFRRYIAKYRNRVKYFIEDSSLYRLPTFSEFEELLNKCSWVWTECNGINGYKVIGCNENSIFIPIGGSKDKFFFHFKECGYYWSSSLVDCRNRFAYALFFDCNVNLMTSNKCDLGHAIRLVKK